VLATTEWLASHLQDPDLVVVDLRWREDGSGRTEYERGHIAGAVFLDWSTDLVDPDHSLAFMLAPPEAFARTMERTGVGDGTRVVAYTDRLGSGPHRLWWACRVYGHDCVRVLDGGLEKWLSEGRPVERGPSRAGRAPKPFTPVREGGRLVAGAEDVAAAARDHSISVLDSRTPEQFRGEAVWFETGPIGADADGIARTPRGDIRAGRVPWAASVPSARLYRDDHTMKSPAELRELFAQAGVTPGARAITYCGVGISASALAFALERAGISEVRLYDASWEEWGRDPELPVARG
jgi:thiosulfate/3-mercaptopyruvate sulfurtransferase